MGQNQLQHMADPTAYLHPLNVSGRLLYLILNLNPMTCDQGLSWQLVLAEEGRIDKNFGRQVKCHRPFCFKGRDVMSLSKYGDNP